MLAKYLHPRFMGPIAGRHNSLSFGQKTNGTKQTKFPYLTRSCLYRNSIIAQKLGVSIHVSVLGSCRVKVRVFD